MLKKNLVSALVSVVAVACVGSGGLSVRVAALQSPRRAPSQGLRALRSLGFLSPCSGTVQALLDAS